MNPLIILVAVGAVILYIIGVYNSLQTIKTRIVASIQEIGNQLKRQANLIPNLMESAKSYLKHEKGVFEMLTSARKSVDTAVKSGSVAAAGKAEDALQNLIPKLQILVESNPQMQASGTINKFMDELRDTADKLTYSRRTLIDLSQEYNMKIVTFPSSLVAMLFGFKPEKGLETAMTGSHVEVSSGEMVDPKVKLD